MGRLIRRLLALALVSALGLVGFGVFVATLPAFGSRTPVTVTITDGAGPKMVASVLEGARLADYPLWTRWILRSQAVFEGLRAGRYAIPGNATPLEIAELLKQGPGADQTRLTLIPGQTVWQATARMRRAGIASPERLLVLAADRGKSAGFGVDVGPRRAPRTDDTPATYLEGFLYPDTYFLGSDRTPESAIRRATARFNTIWSELQDAHPGALAKARSEFGLSGFELVVLASLVEREVQASEEAPVVAGVFFNRLKRGMKLQTDPTLVYHPDLDGARARPKHRRDARNPYNTYAHKGLPPGPIASPGRNALAAVLAPAHHDLLYFVARQDGSGRHVFATTLDGHRRNIERYLK